MNAASLTLRGVEGGVGASRYCTCCGGARHLGEAIDAGVPTRGVLACEDRGESRMSPKRLLSSSVAAPRTLVLITYSLHHS